MKRPKIPLRNMHDIVAACIVLHNICIVNNEGIEKNQIIEAENKLARRIIEGEVRDDSELREERVGITEVRRRILAMKNVSIADEENDTKTYLFLLRKIEKANDLLRKATTMHKTLAKSLSQYKPCKKSSNMEVNSRREIDLMD